jgi:hypothetical protein
VILQKGEPLLTGVTPRNHATEISGHGPFGDGKAKLLMFREFWERPSWDSSGRTMARTGLRMMPTFPSSPLKFRTVGFPQYGFQGRDFRGAFPANWFAILLRALCCQRDSLLCVRDDALSSTSVRAA